MKLTAVEIRILKILRDAGRPLHGVDIRRQNAKLPRGQLYRLLMWLEQHGYVIGQSGDGPRRSYAISDAGEQYLTERSL